jgi:hypothetical protein
MRIPKNKIQVKQSHGDLFYKNNLVTYSGPYYVLNNKFYEGREYSSTSKELITKQDPEYKKMLSIGSVEGMVKAFLNPNLKKFL